MSHVNFLKDFKVTRVSNSAAAAQTAIDSSRVDMTGFDSVVFIALLGDVTVSSVLTLTAKENSADSTSGAAAITGAATAAYTATATDADNKLLVSDIFRPSLRYAYVSLTRTAANAVVDGILAVQYNSKALPITQSSDVLASVFAANQ